MLTAVTFDHPLIENKLTVRDECLLLFRKATFRFRAGN